ncbi:MAG: HD domain-containing protein [Candidatus Thorarchaeota archaeon]
MSNEDITELLSLGEIIKRIPRTGWILSGVISELPETVASHSWGTAYISLLITNESHTPKKPVDIGRVLTMAIIHDLPEAITSDIPHKGESNAWRELHDVKAKLEGEIIYKIFGARSQDKELLELWREYKEGKTLEARIVRSADILDMILHAHTIEEQGIETTRLDEFFHTGLERVQAIGIEPAIALARRLMNLHLERMKKYSS